MRTPEVINLPVAKTQYDLLDEQVMRRTIEQAFAQLREDIRAGRDNTNSETVLAGYRRDFLLMGG